jgi:hypothetical protein
MTLTPMSQGNLPRIAKNHGKSSGFAALRRLGPRLAICKLVRTLAVLVLLSGCLVTDPIEFDAPEGSPPMLLNPPSAKVPLGHIAWVDGTSGITSWKFTLRVRDEDIGQNLQARWRVVKEGNTTPRFEPTIDLPYNGTLTRDFDILLEAGQLDMGKCHRLDVAVSGSFLDDDNPLAFDFALENNDLAVSNFWIWEGPGEIAATDVLKRDLVDSCNAIEDLTTSSSPLEEALP